jgi:hypothetical protein
MLEKVERMRTHLTVGPGLLSHIHRKPPRHGAGRIETGVPGEREGGLAQRGQRRDRYENTRGPVSLVQIAKAEPRQ